MPATERDCPTVARLIEQLIEERHKIDVAVIEAEQTRARLLRAQNAIPALWDALDELARKTGAVDRPAARAVLKAMLAVEAALGKQENP